MDATRRARLERSLRDLKRVMWFVLAEVALLALALILGLTVLRGSPYGTWFLVLGIVGVVAGPIGLWSLSRMRRQIQRRLAADSSR